ncbi:hypothetical protein PC118_g20368 [Phytophthora cactorum]|uniref:Uncharacterized protein n=1 Tax=Phytophthora cactorum TaxID=29920 RepID=A0A8T1EZF0_9STRA|nr:hypothetical protein PC114_g21254 [Phytophthora cactorum]KAG2964350.1 hypothetical protein PC118_g20368 [Phytophthora cactorum]KAG2982557.1 hypothetical protein PC119_g20814 [Phytophthora cactorum]KAG3135322.1 hypothetical protein C6341_g21815 [Phytophthora cactorum]
MRYPVNAKCIVSLLKAVGLLGDALEHPESVGLISSELTIADRASQASNRSLGNQ